MSKEVGGTKETDLKFAEWFDQPTGGRLFPNLFYAPFAARLVSDYAGEPGEEDTHELPKLPLFQPDAWCFRDAAPKPIADIDKTIFVQKLRESCPQDAEALQTGFVKVTRVRGAELDPSLDTMGMMQYVHPKRLSEEGGFSDGKFQWAVGVRGSPFMTAFEVAVHAVHHKLTVEQLQFNGFHYGDLCASTGRQETSTAWVPDATCLNHEKTTNDNIKGLTSAMFKRIVINVRGCELYGKTTTCATANRYKLTLAYFAANQHLQSVAHDLGVTAQEWDGMVKIRNDEAKSGSTFNYKLNVAHAYMASTATATEKWHDGRVLPILKDRVVSLVRRWSGKQSFFEL